MDGWKSRSSGHFSHDLEFIEICDIWNIVSFGTLSSVFVPAFLAFALVSTESFLAVTFAFAIGISLGSALFFVSLSPLFLLLDALLSFLSLPLQFFRSILVPFLFVLFVLQTLLFMLLSSMGLRSSSLLDVVGRFLLRSAFSVRAFPMFFLSVAWLFGFFRLMFQIVGNGRDWLLNRHSWSRLDWCNRFGWFNFCWKCKNHRCTFDQDGRQDLSFSSFDLLLFDWFWMIVSSLQNVQSLVDLLLTNLIFTSAAEISSFVKCSMFCPTLTTSFLILSPI